MSKRISRINSVKNLTFILSAVLGQVAANTALNAEEKRDQKMEDRFATIPAHSRGWLNTFRWAAFKLAFLIPFAFIGLVTVNAKSEKAALRNFVSQQRDRFRYMNMSSPYTQGRYEAWLGWDREFLAEVVTNANKRSAERHAAAAMV